MNNSPKSLAEKPLSSPKGSKLNSLKLSRQNSKAYKNLLTNSSNNVDKSFSVISANSRNLPYSINNGVYRSGGSHLRDRKFLSKINSKFLSNKKDKNSNKEYFPTEHLVLATSNSPNNSRISSAFTMNKQNNLNSILSSEKINELISIDKYNSIKTESMANYRIESMRKSLTSNENEKSKEAKNDNSSVLNRSNSANDKSKINNNINNNSNIGNEHKEILVNIREKNYINPVDSLDILNVNKFLYDNISSSLINIQKIYYNKAQSAMDHFHLMKKKMQKVRISTLVPKNLEHFGINNNKNSNSNSNSNPNHGLNNNSNSNYPTSPNENKNLRSSLSGNIIDEEPEKEDKEEDNMEGGADVFGEFRDDYIEKKKEKEKQKQKKLLQKREKEEVNKMKNRVVKLDEYELYATYKYSFKNFPEGREQFSFKHNLIDIVLFGGLGMNKNNNFIWTLDPSKNFIDFLFYILYLIF